MANLKIFVSSTCYDLNVVRGQLRSFINNIGYEPMMSDYNDVLYDPRDHTHESCVKEIQNADIIILIIGSRFGGKAIPKAVEHLDLDTIKNSSKSTVFFEKGGISITQLEILKAVELEIPIFTFIDAKVSHDHLFYEKNKNKKGFLDNVDFPSIDKKETAIFIFEFINFIRHRSKNNSIVEFSKVEDIQDYLKKQWAALFQRFLFEQKTKKEEIRRLDFLTSELADIKTTLLTTITNDDLKETARGAIKYRRLIDFVYGLCIDNSPSEFILSNKSFNEIFKMNNIIDFIQSDGVKYPSRVTFYVKNDRTFYSIRFPFNLIDLERDFNDFKELTENSKKAIINAIRENEDRHIKIIKYHQENFDEHIMNITQDNND